MKVIKRSGSCEGGRYQGKLTTLLSSRVKIKGVLHGGRVMASDSEPEKFFSFDPPTPLESRFQPQLTPLENIQKR